MECIVSRAMSTGHRVRAAPKRFLLRARNCCGMSRARRSKEEHRLEGVLLTAARLRSVLLLIWLIV